MKKIYIIFLIFFILFSFILTSNSFASNIEVVEFSYKSNDFTITLPGGYGVDYNYYMIVAGSNSSGIYIDLFLTTFPFSYNSDRTYIVAQDNGVYYSGIIRGSSESWHERDFSSLNVSNFAYSVISRSVSVGYIYNTSSYNLNLVSIVSSNFNIYDTEGELVFQPPQTQVAVLPGIIQVTQIPQAMGEIMTIMIPVGLIIFGIGLVILLIRLVISRVT